jgi:tetratricopeptide (TPR) repeat protein
MIASELGDLDGAAKTYHQLGSIAHTENDLVAAREWCLKSVAIKEKQGDLHAAAPTYHLMGRIAEDERDPTAAREWFRKSLAINEAQGDRHSVAEDCDSLGVLAGYAGRFEECAEWLTRAIKLLFESQDDHGLERVMRNFLALHQSASTLAKETMETIWREAGFGNLPNQLADAGINRQ